MAVSSASSTRHRLPRHRDGGIDNSTRAARGTVKIRLSVLFGVVTVWIATFYVGFAVGYHYAIHNELKPSSPNEQQLSQGESKEAFPGMPLPPASGTRESPSKSSVSFSFTPEMSGFAIDAVAIDKKEFLQHLDLGYATEQFSSKKHAHVLMVYQGKSSLPKQHQQFMSFQEATENCESVHVLATRPFHGFQQCFALVGQYESYHVARFVRWDKKNQSISTLHPFQRVGRGLLRKGINEVPSPQIKSIRIGFDFLANYTQSLSRNLDELRPILKSIATKKTIVVMVSNYGQTELLINFVCHAKSRRLKLSSVLVFCTDEPSLKIATSLGLHAYYDKHTMGTMVTSMQDAQRYGDSVFRDMMMVKVTAVHWVNTLGYHVLFQDLDVVWYKNPIPYFQSFDFDLVFQEDGARTVRYAPYSANSGVYYLRHNRETNSFMARMVQSADLIYSLMSHQAVMTLIMAEHASQFGLSIKVLSGDLMLGGGFHFHRNHTYMRALMAKEFTPVLFHMSWTENKKYKTQYMQQSGIWYVQPSCERQDHHRDDINNTNKTMSYHPKIPHVVNMEWDVLQKTSLSDCCSMEPIVTCHYQDKPSVIPCPDSPKADPKSAPFWP